MQISVLDTPPLELDPTHPIYPQSVKTEIQRTRRCERQRRFRWCARIRLKPSMGCALLQCSTTVISLISNPKGNNFTGFYTAALIIGGILRQQDRGTSYQVEGETNCFASCETAKPMWLVKFGFEVAVHPEMYSEYPMLFLDQTTILMKPLEVISDNDTDALPLKDVV